MASRVKAEIEEHFPDAAVALIEGSGGVFVVEADGETVFSKERSGGFPEAGEIARALMNRRIGAL
jgi:selT/selW/selH-like putative selenoprotein